MNKALSLRQSESLVCLVLPEISVLKASQEECFCRINAKRSAQSEETSLDRNVYAKRSVPCVRSWGELEDLTFKRPDVGRLNETGKRL